MTSRYVHAGFSGTVWQNSNMSWAILTYYWLLMYIMANFRFDLREPPYGKMKMLIVGAFMIVG